MKTIYSLFVIVIILNSFSCGKFGQDGPFLSLDITEDITTKEFFNNYVKNKKAVMIKNGCQKFPALKLWSDEYLLNKSHGFDDLKLTVETVKKETRNQNVLGYNYLKLFFLYTKFQLILTFLKNIFQRIYTKLFNKKLLFSE